MSVVFGGLFVAERSHNWLYANYVAQFPLRVEGQEWTTNCQARFVFVTGKICLVFCWHFILLCEWSFIYRFFRGMPSWSWWIFHYQRNWESTILAFICLLIFFSNWASKMVFKFSYNLVIAFSEHKCELYFCRWLWFKNGSLTITALLLRMTIRGGKLFPCMCKMGSHFLRDISTVCILNVVGCV